LETRERTLGPEHLDTLVSVNNLAWLRLDRTDGIPVAEFERLLVSWTDPTDWKHHWARLGVALCALKEAGEAAPAEAVLSDLIALLGPEHHRVSKARERLLAIRPS